MTTSYNAEQTTVTDQAGKTRRSIIDGLGRLKQVIEDPNSLNYATTYSYDVLGNLTLVQQGAQQRQFTYDSVSRLREAYNPEQQMVATVYQYDDGSNLLSRANPNGTSVSFTYDGLNRAKTKTLSTGGLWNYSYDTGTNGKGRLASVVKQGVSDGCYYDGYDAVGRLSGSHQITGGVSYTLGYGYDLAGSMTKEVYPSGKEVRTSYDNAGRITGVSRHIGGVFDKTYASQFSYTAHWAAKALQLGNAKWEHTSFNSRLQPTLIGLGTSGSDSSIVQLTYGYGTTNNNGNVATQTITIGATQMNQSYGYDGLNRLSSATETGAWTQTYDYDRYGNRAMRSGSYIPQSTFDATVGIRGRHVGFQRD